MGYVCQWFSFQCCRRLSFTVFLFPFRKAYSYKAIFVSICEAHQTIRCASPFELGVRWVCRGDKDGEGDGDGEGYGDSERDEDLKSNETDSQRQPVSRAPLFYFYFPLPLTD